MLWICCSPFSPTHTALIDDMSREPLPSGPVIGIYAEDIVYYVCVVTLFRVGE